MIKIITKEFLKLIVSTIFFPIVIFITFFITFIAAHEAIWKSIEGKTETE